MLIERLGFIRQLLADEHAGEGLYWLRLRAGARRRAARAEPSEPSEPPETAPPPLFVLSTGRVATQTLAYLLRASPRLAAFHEPAPTLFRLGCAAYRWEAAPHTREVLREAFLAMRETRLERARRWGLGYAETGPHLTFLAPMLAELYPDSRFVHLVRDPASVARSGLQRGWYAGNPLDPARITPRAGCADAADWDGYSCFEKILWNWAETNAWIEGFRAGLPPERSLLLRTEALVAPDLAAVAPLFAFAGVPMPARAVLERVLARRHNRSRAKQPKGAGRRESPAPAGEPPRIAEPLRARIAELAGRVGCEPL